MSFSIWIGWDPHEVAAYDVARTSARARCSLPGIPIRGVVLEHLQQVGLYNRPTSFKPGVERDILWDDISQAPMSTEFAISRFFVPHLAPGGWAMFMDCDVLVRANISALLQSLDRKYAVYCVKHDYRPHMGTKMDGQVQTAYPRKNWSSVMIFNCEHEANKALTLDLLNSAPGRELHRFCWLRDKHIGALDPAWNWLVGEQPEPEHPNIVHYTLGTPNLPRYRASPYADEWFATLQRHAA